MRFRRYGHAADGAAAGWGRVSDDYLHPDLAARLTALEQMVSHLYAELGLAPPAVQDALAQAVGEEAEALIAAGDRDGAIRAVMESQGVSLVTAVTRVDGYRRHKGW